MKILLIYSAQPSRPSNFHWSMLVAILSRHYEIRTAWWITEVIDESKIDPELISGITLSSDIRSYEPDLILIEDRPAALTPNARSRRIPLDLERELLQKGTSLVFLNASPEINNFRDDNQGFIDYGFPICLSKSHTPVRLANYNSDRLIRMQDWQVPIILQYPPFDKIKILSEITMESPFILDDRMDYTPYKNSLHYNGEPLIFAPSNINGKDPVWVYEDDLIGVKRPYVIAAWKSYPGHIFLFTGDLFSDFVIKEGDNVTLLQMLINGISALQKKRSLMKSGLPANSAMFDSINFEKTSPRSVFLSHSWQDKDFVKRLAQDLEMPGITVWLDEAEIKIGDSLIDKIRTGIDQMDYLAVILSRVSIKSEWVKKEVDIAMNQEIAGRRVKVLPILIDNLDQAEIPSFLVGKLYADFTTPTGYKEGLKTLLGRLAS